MKHLAPARHAIAIPSPVASFGLVVCKKSWPSPPVARIVLDDNIGIANVRKEIVYHAGKIRFCMWDDDVIFYRRNRKYYRYQIN